MAAESGRMQIPNKLLFIILVINTCSLIFNPQKTPNKPIPIPKNVFNPILFFSKILFPKTIPTIKQGILPQATSILAYTVGELFHINIVVKK